jgi:hypothetical protein
MRTAGTQIIKESTKSADRSEGHPTVAAREKATGDSYTRQLKGRLRPMLSLSCCNDRQTPPIPQWTVARWSPLGLTRVNHLEVQGWLHE